MTRTRTVELTRNDPGDYAPYRLEIVTTGPRSVAITHYHLRPLASDWGAAFRLEKFSCDGGEVYDVCLDDAGHDSCDCVGHQRHGYCKHTATLRELIARRELPMLASAPQPRVRDDGLTLEPDGFSEPCCL